MIELITPLLLAALGGLLSQQVGMLNIALEGLIQGGAFVAAVIFFYTENSFLATLAAIGIGSTVCWFLIGWHLIFKTNLFLAGLAINLLIPALADLILQAFLDTQGTMRLPFSSDSRPLTFFFFIFALSLTGILAFFLYRTSFGLRSRAARSSEALLKSRGLFPSSYKATTFILSGGLSGLAGAALTLGLEVYVSGISAGKGWLALTAVYLGFCRSWGVLIACLILGIIGQFSYFLQEVISYPGLTLSILPLGACLIFVVINALLKKQHSLSRFMKKMFDISNAVF